MEGSIIRKERREWRNAMFVMVSTKGKTGFAAPNVRIGIKNI